MKHQTLQRRTNFEIISLQSSKSTKVQLFSEKLNIEKPEKEEKEDLRDLEDLKNGNFELPQ